MRDFLCNLTPEVSADRGFGCPMAYEFWEIWHPPMQLFAETGMLSSRCQTELRSLKIGVAFISVQCMPVNVLKSQLHSTIQYTEDLTCENVRKRLDLTLSVVEMLLFGTTWRAVMEEELLTLLVP